MYILGFVSGMVAMIAYSTIRRVRAGDSFKSALGAALKGGGGKGEPDK